MHVKDLEGLKTLTEAPLSHRKHCSQNASSVVVVVDFGDFVTSHSSQSYTFA